MFASPSGGSRFADLATDLTFLLPPGLRNVDRLRTDSSYLVELDQEFKDLVNGSDRPSEDRLNIMGAEVVEGNDYVGGKRVVDRSSAAHYFAYQTLPGDHSSLVKPDSSRSPSHEFVVDFYRRSFSTSSPPSTRELPNDLHIEVPPRANDVQPIGSQIFRRPSENWQSEVWSMAQAWNTAIRLGDSDSINRFYAERLDYYYGNRNVSGRSAVRELVGAMEKFPQRNIYISDPTFIQLDAEHVEIVFDKSYRLLGPSLSTVEGKVKHRLRFASFDGTWKITGQKDDQICWSSSQRDPTLRFPPGACQ